MIPHSQRLERWLGAEQVADISHHMRNWYGPPIAVHGVPGSVYATGGGDFIGEYRGPAEMSAIERGMEIVVEQRRRRFKTMFPKQQGSFSGLSALITAKTSGKSVTMLFNKTGTAPTATQGAMDLWTNTGQPAAGAAGGALPGGTVPTNATTGNLGYINAVVNANTGHFVNAQIQASVVPNTLLLYDRLWAAATNPNSTSTQAATATAPTRYTSTTAGALNYAGGNFAFPSNPTTVLAATAHNWTVCQYTNQAGTTAQSFPSIAGISACAVHQIDLVLGSWFMPLNGTDTGLTGISQIQLSAAVATGTIDMCIGHPIAMMPCLIANAVMNIDGVTSAFNLQQVYDNACLALIEMPKAATTATNYSGIVMTVSE